MKRRWLLVVGGVWLVAAAVVAEVADTSCTLCHSDAQRVGQPGSQIVREFAADVHSQVGLSCHDCHGGNPSPQVATQRAAAEDPAYQDNPYRGHPARIAVPGFCGQCHSSPTYMKRFKPDARVDQESEYRTSRHGQLLEQGDPNVATCIDCHKVHGIRRVADPASPVYPTRVAETCRDCHADAERMAGYQLGDGQPFPIDQYERWALSVHATALLKKEDLSAPTCNDCHGNHGAAPPGLESIALVCGNCHGREASLFRDSPKRKGFIVHNEILQGEEQGCVACHEGEPAAALTGVRQFTECTTCHNNHAIITPTLAMLGPLPQTPCEFCHTQSVEPDEARGESERRGRYEQTRDELLAEGRAQGLDGDALFDRLVEALKILPPHLESSRLTVEGKLAMQPEFRRLFEKFRIGSTHFKYRDPRTGQMVSEKVVRCTSCHGDTPPSGAAGGAAGGAAEVPSATFLDKMRVLTTSIGRAERLLLAARRGGVAVHDGEASLDQAVSAQIQLEVLVHGFSVDAGGAFFKAFEDGMQHARAAAEKGRAASDELAYRRRGLAASLGIILVVLVALGLKIRELSQRRAKSGA